MKYISHYLRVLFALVFFVTSVVAVADRTYTGVVHSFTSTPPPVGWTTNGTFNNSYYALTQGQYVQATASALFGDEELSTDMTISIACGTYGNWTSPKTITFKAVFYDISDNELSSCLYTTGALKNTASTYRGEFILPKPQASAPIAYFKVFFQTLTSTSSGSARFSAIKLSYSTQTPENVTYTLLYDANGGISGTVPSSAVMATGESVEVAGNTGQLTKTGYTFAGWNTQADGSGTSYQPGQSISLTANTTLYAQWTKNVYTVNWLVNNSPANGTPTTSVAYNEQVTALPTTPTSTDFDGVKTFMGWTTSEVNDGMCPAVLFTTASESPAITDNTTFYAVFATEITTEDGAGVWTLVTDASDLVNGETYTIGSSSTPLDGYVMGAQASNNVSASKWSTGLDSFVKFVLEGTTGAWEMHVIGGSYFYAPSATSGSNNYLKQQTPNNSKGLWTIIPSAGATTIKVTGGSGKYILRYNSNSQLFSCYGSGQEDVYLFKFSSVPLISYSDYATTTGGFTPEPTLYTITFKDKDAVIDVPITVAEGEPITFPTDCDACPGWEFAGWSAKENDITVEDIYTNAHKPNATADATYHAIYCKTTVNGEEACVHVTNAEIMAALVNRTNTNYAVGTIESAEAGTWTGKFSCYNTKDKRLGLNADAYLVSPVFTSEILNITIKSYNGSNSNNGDWYICGAETTSPKNDAIEQGKVTKGAVEENVSIDIPGNCRQIYIYASRALQIHSITLTLVGERTTVYALTCEEEPSIPLIPATIAFAGDQDAATIDIADYAVYQLPAVVTNSAGSISYSSSNGSVATVSQSGLVTLAKRGITTITATVAATATHMEASAEFILTVTDRLAPTEVTFDFTQHTYGIYKDNGSSPDTYEPDHDKTIAEGIVSMEIVSPQYRIWENYLGVTDLRLYNLDGVASTWTFTVPEGYSITSITYTGETVNYIRCEEDRVLDNNTWTGDEQSVSFTQTKASKISTIVVAYRQTGKPLPTLAFAAPAYVVKVGDTLPAPECVGESDGSLSFASANLNVATVNNIGDVFGVAVGETVITAIQSETDDYAQGSASYRLMVWPQTVSVWVGSTEWATFAPSYNIGLPEVEGEEAPSIYYISSQSENQTWVRACNFRETLYPNDVIAASTGMLVHAAAGTEVQFPVSTATDRVVDAETLGSLLVGVTEATDMTGCENAYIFTRKYIDNAYRLGFYVCTGGTLEANKCYLQLTPEQAANAPRFLMFFDEGETPIGYVFSAEKDVPVYDLTGRRVTRPYKGVGIKDGQKVLMK